MGTLSIVVSNQDAVVRLTDALDERFRLVFHDNWRDFEERVRSLRPQALIVDPYSPVGPPTAHAAIELGAKAEFGVVVCSDFGGRARDLFALGLAGVPSVLILPDLGTRVDVQQAVERAIAASVANAVVARLEERAPRLALDAIHWAVGHATEGATAEDLARGLSITPKALGNRLRKKNLPPARRTMLWGRLFYAAWALSRGEETIEDLSRRLGYATRSGLTKALSEAVGAPPTTLAAGDARAPVVEAFLHEIYVT